MTTAFILIGLNAIILLILFLYVRRRLNNELSSRKLVDEAYTEVNQMIVQLNETTERNIALIEERIDALSSILTTADKRVATLANRQKPNRQKNADSASGYLDLGKPGARQPISNEAQLVTTSPPPKSPPPKTSSQDTERKTPDPARVIELYEQGIEASLIASRLGTTIGEVELIISLRSGNV